VNHSISQTATYFFNSLLDRAAFDAFPVSSHKTYPGTLPTLKPSLDQRDEALCRAGAWAV